LLWVRSERFSMDITISVPSFHSPRCAIETNFMEKKSRCSLVVTVTRLPAARPWFDSLHGRGLSPFSKVQSFSDSNLTTCLKRAEGSLPGVKRPDMKLTIHLHLVPRLRMRGAIPPLPYTSSWGAHEICYIYFTPCYTTRIPSLKIL
jgi:hypothetical protein